MRFLNRREPTPTSPARARRGRRLHRQLLAGMAASLVVGGCGGEAWWLARSGTLSLVLAATQERIARIGAAYDLKVTSVEVEGRQRAGREAILAALQVQRGTPILAIDLPAAQARLEAISWIRSAAVERRLPDTIFVRLVEHQPLAVWQHQGKFDLIDQAGAVIPAARVDEFSALPQVVGEHAAEQAPALLDMLSSEADLARHVDAAVHVCDRRWNLEFDNGVEVLLPEQDAESAWHRLAALDRSDRLLERDVRMIDLRLPDRLTVRLAPESDKAPAKKSRSGGKSTS
jgi:cell division protein FtsQ